MWSWRNEALANSVCSGIIRTGIKIPAPKQQAKQHQHAFHSPDGADTGGPWGPNSGKMQAPHSGRDPASKKHIESDRRTHSLLTSNPSLHASMDTSMHAHAPSYTNTHVF